MLKNIGLIALLSFGHAISAGATQSHEIIMKSISYEPKTLTIQAGDSVVWDNRSYTDHSATEVSAFDTGMVSPGKKSKAIVFSKPGSFKYHCTLHGTSMSGTLTVTETPKK